ncbi:MAG: hypothetical protein ABH854_05790 [Candidatus Diapherotrites archaeon]
MTKIQKARLKGRAIHVMRASEEMKEGVEKRGLIPHKITSDTIPDEHHSFAEIRVRLIFDAEKPKRIQAGQTNSVFFIPATNYERPKKGFVEAKVGMNSIVADAGAFEEALHIFERSKSPYSPSKKEIKQIRDIARKYWSTAITYGDFIEQYEERAIPRAYQPTKFVYVRKAGARKNIPRIIIRPEILYPNKIRPEQLKVK